MMLTTKLVILGARAALVLGLAIAVGNTKAGSSRRTLARAGASAFFAFLASFFWLSPFAVRGRFLTGMAIFFSIGGAISVWKLVSGLSGSGASEKSATH
jgi:hypothetical protein